MQSISTKSGRSVSRKARRTASSPSLAVLDLMALICQHGAGDQGIHVVVFDEQDARRRFGSAHHRAIGGGCSRAGGASAGSKIGHETQKTEPKPSLLLSVMPPPSNWAISYAIVRPSPVPSRRRSNSRSHLLEGREHQLLVVFTDADAGIPDLEVKLARLLAIAAR